MNPQISIDNGYPGDGMLKLYVKPRELGEALKEELAAAGVETDGILEHGMVQDLFVFAVGFASAGGIRQIATLLEAWVRQNDGKEITLKADGELQTKGLSAAQFEKVLSAAVEKQKTIDENWKKLSGDTTDDATS